MVQPNKLNSRIVEWTEDNHNDIGIAYHFENIHHPLRLHVRTNQVVLSSASLKHIYQPGIYTLSPAGNNLSNSVYFFKTTLIDKATWLSGKTYQWNNTSDKFYLCGSFDLQIEDYALSTALFTQETRLRKTQVIDLVEHSIDEHLSFVLNNMECSDTEMRQHKVIAALEEILKIKMYTVGLQLRNLKILPLYV